MASRPKSVSGNNTSSTNPGWTRRAMSRDEKLVRQGIMAYEQGREGAVSELKTAVWAGTYDPDLQEVAGAIIVERESQTELTREEEASFSHNSQ